MNKYLKVRCKKHKCDLVEELFIDGQSQEIDFVCPKCVKDFEKLNKK